MATIPDVAMASELRRVARAHRALASARQEREEAVVAAAASGHSLRAIAASSGIGLRQVLRIVQRGDEAQGAGGE